MRPLTRIFFGVLLALCCSGLAVADPHDPTQSLDSSTIRRLTLVQLDTAFERSASEGSGMSLYGLGGPSSMDCTSSPLQAGIETCVVTTRRRATSMPAALTQR